MRMRPLAATASLAALLAACTIPPIETPTPRPTSEPTPSATTVPPPVPSATDLGAASPGADLEAIPAFTGSEVVTTTFAGLRVRLLPGTEQPVVTGLLGDAADLEVVMGPIVVDDLGWYLVRDADGDEPQFEEGWVAAGFEPDANLRATGQVAADSPVVVSLAYTGDAEFGPIAIPDERHVIRWVAVDPEGEGCRFAISLTAGSAAAIPSIRATIGRGQLIPGVLQSSFFVAQPELRGQLFLTADTDCAWTLAVLREEPQETPAP